MGLKNLVVIFLLLFNLSWAQEVKKAAPEAKVVDVEEVRIKIVPEQKVTYTANFNLEVSQNTSERVVPIATFSSDSELTAGVFSADPVEELVISPLSYLFKGEVGPLSLTFDLKGAGDDHPITRLLKKGLIVSHRFPLSTDRNFLVASTENYPQVPVEDDKIEAYISFVKEVQKLINEGMRFKVGKISKQYENVEHTMTVDSITAQTVETTHDLKWEDKQGTVGTAKFLVSHSRSNLLLSQITGDVKIISQDNFLKSIPGYDVEGPIVITLKVDVHAKL